MYIHPRHRALFAVMRWLRKALLALFVVLAFSGCKKDDFPKVKYRVNCASCDLTYSNQDEGTAQTSMSGSWTYDFTAKNGQFLYISAQNNNASGTVKVWIEVDGSTFKEAISSGAYVIATASGSAP